MDNLLIPELSFGDRHADDFTGKLQLPLPKSYFNSPAIYFESPLEYVDAQTQKKESKRLVACFLFGGYSEAIMRPFSFCSGFNQDSNMISCTFQPLNKISYVLNKFDMQKESFKGHQPVFNILNSPVVHDKVHSTQDLSDESSCEEQHLNDSKVPSKQHLYRLSTMIQNTTPTYENFIAGDVKAFVDECKIVNGSLFISKNINGFEWNFELYFEKNSTTCRNRRMLRCKHYNCNKVFKKAWNLFDHMRIHTGEKPYQCKQCGRRFAQNGNLTKHLKLHLKKNRKIHSCKICGKTYTEKFNLKVHLKKHRFWPNETSDEFQIVI